MDPFSIPDLAPDSQQEGTCGAVAGDALLIWKPFSVTTQPSMHGGLSFCKIAFKAYKYDNNKITHYLFNHMKDEKVKDQNDI